MGDDEASFTQKIAIAAQNISNLTVDVAAQSIGDLAVDISTQSISDLDIFYTGQNAAVKSGTEFAATNDDLDGGSASGTVIANSSTTLTIYTNTTGGQVVLETATIALRSNFTQEFFIKLEVDQNGDGTTDFSYVTNPPNGILNPTPGIPIQDGGDLTASLTNNSGSNVSVEGTLVGRT